MTTAAASKHLRSLLDNRFGSTDAQIVFLDIIGYSRRKSTVQRALVERFQLDIKEALNSVGREYIEYAQINDINFSNDIIKIPTGDGAAIGFTFDGVQRIALDFAIALLSRLHGSIVTEPCEKFTESGWCNCHTHYSVRIGINEGKAIIFTDMNGLVNVAGSCINNASRVMGFADKNQILLSETSYNNLIDMTVDISLEEQFVDLGKLKIKHGAKLGVYQYVGSDEPYIEREPPMAAIFNQNMDKMAASMGIPEISGDTDKKTLMKMMEGLSNLGEIFGAMANTPPPMKTIKPKGPVSGKEADDIEGSSN